MTGKVYIASMKMRGKWAEPIPEKCIKIYVTSAQSKTSKNRINFSPMNKIPGTYKGYFNFEHYWQSGKVYDDVSFEKSRQWWLDIKTPKRRYPHTKTKNVLYGIYENDKKLDSLTARKEIYVPEYFELIKDKELIQYWKNKLNENNLVIYDFDGPKNENGDVICLELTKELLKEKINDTKHPFGHGYIVAGLINNILPENYI